MWLIKRIRARRAARKARLSFWVDLDEYVLYGPFESAEERNRCEEARLPYRRLPGYYWIDPAGFGHGPFFSKEEAQEDERNWDGVIRECYWFDHLGAPHGPFATMEECRAAAQAEIDVRYALEEVLSSDDTITRTQDGP